MQEIAYTWHGARQCNRRGISDHDVQQAILNGERSTDGRNDLYTLKRLQVVINGGMLITAYRLPKGEPKRRKRKAGKSKPRLMNAYRNIVLDALTQRG